MTLLDKKSIINFICYLLRKTEDFIFPPLCIICDSVRNNKNRWLCEICLQKIEYAIKSRKMCPKCGQNLNIYSCSCKNFWDYPFSRIISFVDYKDIIPDIVHQIKYSGKKRLALYMGEICSNYFSLDLYDINFDIAIPLPLHPLRLYQRGFNQAEWFAKGLLKQSKKNILIDNSILKRVHRTKTQTTLNKVERIANLEGAFRVTLKGKNKIKGRSILLIDDVVTTGATTSSAALTLLENGCKEVTVISFARD